MFNWSEVHLYRSNFLQNPYFSEIQIHSIISNLYSNPLINMLSDYCTGNLYLFLKDFVWICRWHWPLWLINFSKISTQNLILFFRVSSVFSMSIVESIPITSSSHVFTNSVTTNLRFFFQEIFFQSVYFFVKMNSYRRKDLRR